MTEAVAAKRALPRAKRIANLALAIALGTISGSMWFLATPPRRFFWLAWFAMIPVFVGVDRARNWKEVALVAWVAGTVTSLGGFSWIGLLLERFAGLPRAAALGVLLLFCLYQGVTCLLFGIVTYRIRRHTDLPMTLIAPVTFVTFEWMVPLLFPWYLAITQAKHPLLIQTADLTGPLGITALLLVANGTVYDLITKRRGAIKVAAIGTAIIAFAIVYGHFRIRHFDEVAARAPKLAVGIVQPNIPYDEKGARYPEFRQEQLRALQEQSRKLQDAGAQLVVWSETTYPYWLPKDLKADFALNDQRRVMRDFTVPVITGVNTFSGARGRWNSAMLLDSQGRVAGIYDKMELLPFGEAIPAWLDFQPIKKLIPAGFGDFSRGEAARTLPFVTSDNRQFPVGAIVCYEDILPQLLRKVGGLHPYLLVNVTNDAWYGADIEPAEHLALAVFGSVEQRTSMVRAVNSGISAFIDPNGRIVQQTEAIDPIVDRRPVMSLLVRVPMLLAGSTPFAIWGNVFTYLCVTLTIVFVAQTFRTPELARRHKRRTQ